MDLLLFCSAGLPELLPARRHLIGAAHAAGDVLLLLPDTTPGDPARPPRARGGKVRLVLTDQDIHVQQV
jgi:hypothetical protein